MRLMTHIIIFCLFSEEQADFFSDLLFEGVNIELELEYACALCEVLLTFCFVSFSVPHPYIRSD